MSQEHSTYTRGSASHAGADPMYRRPAAQEPGLFDLPPATAITPTLAPLPYGGQPPAHRNARPTERAAANRVARTAPTIRDRVLGWVRDAGAAGMTAAEGGARLAAERGAHPNDSRCRYTIAPRLTELGKIGLVADSGTRREGCIAWVATAAGATAETRGASS